MSYCTIDQVQAFNVARSVYSSSTKPSASQVTGFINQVTAEIDTLLDGRSVVVPVTSPSHFLAFLALVNATGAAALAEGAQFPESDGGSGSTPHAEKLYSDYQEFLAAIEAGTAIPASAVMQGGVRAHSYLTDNPNNTGTDGADGFTGVDWGTLQQPHFSMQRVWALAPLGLMFPHSSVTIALGLAALGYLVGDVFIGRTQEQMARPHARRIVASVAHIQARWNRSVGFLPRPTMSLFRHPANSEGTITTAGDVSRPNPTVTNARHMRGGRAIHVDLLPETGREVAGSRRISASLRAKASSLGRICLEGYTAVRTYIGDSTRGCLGMLRGGQDSGFRESPDLAIGADDFGERVPSQIQLFAKGQYGVAALVAGEHVSGDSLWEHCDLQCRGATPRGVSAPPRLLVAPHFTTGAW